jgi:hypothetical protein
VVSGIADNRSSEVIVTFGPNWFSRREGLNSSQMDDVFGGPEYWKRANQDATSRERWQVWLDTYRDALERAGFNYRLHFKVVPRTGLPLYLVYGTRHKAGLKVMKEAMWTVDAADGMRFADPRTTGAESPGQMSIWNVPGSLDPELLELTRQRLGHSPRFSAACAPDPARSWTASAQAGPTRRRRRGRPSAPTQFAASTAHA